MRNVAVWLAGFSLALWMMSGCSDSSDDDASGGSTPTATPVAGSPTPGGTSTPVVTPVVTPGVTPTPAPTPTLPPEVTPTPEGTPSASPTPEPTPTPEGTPETPTPVASPTPASIPEDSPTPTGTPEASPTPVPTPTPSPTPVDQDKDDDGYDALEFAGTDCNDLDASIHPGATEVAYDGIDQDCNGVDLIDVDGDGQAATSVGGTDCDDTDDAVYAGAVETPYDDIDQDCSGADLTDVDGDGYDGLAAAGDDCDDNDLNSYPGALEFADGKDNDCDGKIDEDLPTTDDDGDGLSEADGDCNDADPGSYPGAQEVPYDGIDQNCDGLDLTDVDGDGSASTEVAGGTDCDDEDGSVYPGASEVPYDSIDQDCSGADLIDVDGDGYAASSVAGGTDCNDGDAQINPGAAELCDGTDNNCNAQIDEGVTAAWYQDADSDGYGNPASSIQACTQPAGYVSDKTDCNDANAAIHPGASEVADGVDQNCNGQVDEGVYFSSCKAILAAYPGSVSGTYTIDVDGPGAAAPFNVYCDMTTSGGGWTLVFHDDFESTPDAGWSIKSTYLCASWTTILGGYNIIAGGEISNTINTWGVPHDTARTDIQYIKLDSWDGEQAYVKGNGSSLWTANLYYYEGSEVCGWNRGYNGSYDDRHSLSLSMAHTGSSFLLVAGSKLDQSPSDESFGIDNVYLWLR